MFCFGIFPITTSPVLINAPEAVAGVRASVIAEEAKESEEAKERRRARGCSPP
jgi:hypothetical protein